ncbi:hypothetical protein M434DRAFT_400889 [Hypoxylon sp. CO27-5]|nr:hypothetical protein M434DRAFT_400889 [Hypoxylon sp. CO27-5]
MDGPAAFLSYFQVIFYFRNRGSPLADIRKVISYVLEPKWQRRERTGKGTNSNKQTSVPRVRHSSSYPPCVSWLPAPATRVCELVPNPAAVVACLEAYDAQFCRIVWYCFRF